MDLDHNLNKFVTEISVLEECSQVKTTVLPLFA